MKKQNMALTAVSAFIVFLSLAPYAYIFFQGARTDTGEFSIQNYYKVFLATPQYLLRFWKSIFLSSVIAFGQVIVSTLAGYGFAKCRFPGKNAAFFLLIVLMVMPLQVTLVPNYIFLEKMGLINTYRGLIYPGIFAPLGTFIMTQGFRTVPNEIIDAARLDGCGTIGALFHIAAPMSKNALVCTFLLSFLDSWNMVEQPIVYLENFADYPLSVALASVSAGGRGVQLVCCLLVMIPPLYLFIYFHQEMLEGIALGKEK